MFSGTSRQGLLGGSLRGAHFAVLPRYSTPSFCRGAPHGPQVSRVSSDGSGRRSGPRRLVSGVYETENGVSDTSVLSSVRRPSRRSIENTCVITCGRCAVPGVPGPVSLPGDEDPVVGTPP